jgi:hypothetical protein
MDRTTFVTIIALPLVLAVAGSILLFFLFHYVRYCPADHRIVIIRSPVEVSVFGPGWVFLKPYRGKVLKLSIRPQECMILLWSKPVSEVKFRFEIVDAGKAVLKGIQLALFSIENADLSEREKLNRRLMVPYEPMNTYIRAFVRRLVAAAYDKAVREDPGLGGPSLPQATLVLQEELERDLRDRGIALLSLTVEARAATNVPIDP